MVDAVDRKIKKVERKAEKIKGAASNREYERVRSQMEKLANHGEEPSAIKGMLLKYPAPIAAVSVIAAGALSWVLLINPFMQETETMNLELADLTSANSAMEAEVPVLRTELSNIAPRVAELEALSTKVPAVLDQPLLYKQLDAIAEQSGVDKPTSLDVQPPTPVVIAPAAPPPVTNSADDAEGASAPAPAPVEQAPAMAQYTVSFTISGDTSKILDFFENLRNGPRMAILSGATIDIAEDGVAKVSLSPTFYLQQVDVQGIADQLQQLLEATGMAQPKVAVETEPVDPQATDGATDPASPPPAGGAESTDGLPNP